MSKKNIQLNHIDHSMNFELAMRQFFGEKAYHIAGGYNNPKYVKQWLKKAIRKMKKDIMNLDTTSRHKETLINDIGRLERNLKSSDPFEIIIVLFSICSRFLGYDFLKGEKFNIPIYSQNASQYYWSKILKDSSINYSREQSRIQMNIVRKQKEIIKSLLKEGFDDFQISLVLNVSEYQIKKLKKGI